MMRIYINGNEKTNFLLEVPYTDTLDKTLDTFTFQYRTQSDPATEEANLLKYSKVRIYDSALGLDKYLALQDYTCKLEGKTWIYNVDCISPTKILENIIVNGMAETLKNTNLKNQFSRVMTKINKQLEWEGQLGTYPQLAMSQRLQDFLNGRSSRDFKWDGQYTAREIFDDFLRPLDAYIIVSDFTPVQGFYVTPTESYNIYRISTITLDFVLENGADIDDLTDTDHEIARGTTITNALQTIDNGLNQDYKIANFETYNESEYDMASCKAIVTNAVPDNYYTTNWCNPRSESTGIWSSDNVCMITDEPIYDVDRDNFSLLTLATCSVEYVTWVSEDNPNIYTTNGNDPSLVYIGFPLPLGDYLYEKAEYDILPETKQRKALYFERGKKNIYGFTKMYKDNVEGKFNVVAINNIINDILSDFSGRLIPLWDNWAVSTWYADYIDDTQNISTIADIITDGTTYLNGLSDNNLEAPQIVGYILRNGIQIAGTHGTTHTLTFDGSTNLYSVKHMHIQSLSSNIEKMLFNAMYKPYINTVAMANKLDSSNKIKTPGYTTGLSIMQNQNSKNVDMERFCSSQQSLINRLGERIAHLDVKINTSKGGVLWPLGDFIRVKPNANDETLGDCWKITQREITQYNDTTYKCRYTLSKNYNAKNSNIELDREVRTFDIPLDGFIDRYIYVRVPKSTDLSRYDASLTYCTDYETYSCYSLNNISKYASDSLEFFKTSFIDNYSANIYKTKINNTKINAPLRYCDDDGELTNLSISLANYNDVNKKVDLCTLPRIETSIYSTITKYSRTLSNIYKDPFERIIVVFFQERSN